MFESLDLIPQFGGCLVLPNGFLTLNKCYFSLAHSVSRSSNDLDIPIGCHRFPRLQEAHGRRYQCDMAVQKTSNW